MGQKIILLPHEDKHIERNNVYLQRLTIFVALLSWHVVFFR